MRKTLVGLVGLLSVAAAAGCRPAVETKARSLIVPASLVWALVSEPPGTGQVLKLVGRTDSNRRIETADGTPIDLWVIKSRRKGTGAATTRPAATQPSSRGTVVILHPLLAGKAWFLKTGVDLAARGFNVVLMDLRAHGYSGGKYTTWGAKEKHDVKTVVDTLLEEGAIAEPIYVLGSSMGGAVAVQYAAIDPRCRGVVAIAPPQNCREITRRMMLLESEGDYQAALAKAAELADFDPNDASAEAAAAKLKCPLILVHGFLDVIVPYQHGEAVFKAAPEPKKFITLWADGHASEFARDRWVADRVDELSKMADR